jgi:hypothetical protein
LAKPHVPLVQTIDGHPIVLDPNIGAGDRALVVLYQHGAALRVDQLRRWVEYGNATRLAGGRARKTACRKTRAHRRRRFRTSSSPGPREGPAARI